MKRILIVVMVLMLIPVTAFCSTTKVLDRETELRPQGWTAGALKFKQGSTVELNDRGQVITGVLKEDTYTLRPTGVAYVSLAMYVQPPRYSWYIYFTGGPITFDERGWVLSGTISSDTDTYLIPNVDPLVRFKKKTIILFDRNRNVVRGTICDDTFLCPAGWEKFLTNSSGILKFKAETEVVFGADAQVIKGTIADDLAVNGITYPAGTTLQFSESAYPQKI